MSYQADALQAPCPCKVAGISVDGTGSRRLTVGSEAGPFTDPDGFVWEAAGIEARFNSRLDPTLGLAGLAARESIAGS
jgi:hypothetical protein